MVAKTLDEVCDALQLAWRQKSQFRIVGYVTSNKLVYDYHLCWFDPVEPSVYDHLLAASCAALEPAVRRQVFERMRREAPESVPDSQISSTLEGLYEAYQRRLKGRTPPTAREGTYRDLVPGAAWAVMTDMTLIESVQLSMVRLCAPPVLREGVAKPKTLTAWAELLLPLGSAQGRLVLRPHSFSHVEVL
jgi:hypothetical protein